MSRTQRLICLYLVVATGVALWTPRGAMAGEVVVVTSFPKELFEAYKDAFEARNPGVTVVIKSRPTSAIVAYIQETASRPDADIVWASATDAFAVLKLAEQLAGQTYPDSAAG